jgi:ATP/maltotriose-dependent transcriptional regulator MalT
VTHLLPRIADPFVLTSFLNSHALTLVMRGSYEQALHATQELARYAKDLRLPFVTPHCLMLSIMALIGLRRFDAARARLNSLQQWLATEPDRYVQLCSAILHAKVAIAQHRFEEALDATEVDVSDPPTPGAAGEALAYRALALACSDELAEALSLAARVDSTTKMIEPRTVAACVRDIVSVKSTSRSCATAFNFAWRFGSLDAFVSAYRGAPELLQATRAADGDRPELRTVLVEARDKQLGQRFGLAFEPHPAARLTPRETEIQQLVAEGLSNREISRRLFISEVTVKAHLRHIFTKLGVRSRTQVALRAGADQRQAIAATDETSWA